LLGSDGFDNFLVATFCARRYARFGYWMKTISKLLGITQFQTEIWQKNAQNFQSYKPRAIGLDIQISRLTQVAEPKSLQTLLVCCGG